MPRTIVLASRFCLALLLGSTTLTNALANGGKAKKLVLEARIPSGEGRWLFTSEIVPVQYRLNTIRNKYKLIQIRVNNSGGKPLRLSRSSDKIEVKIGSSFVPAIVNLPDTDPDFWDNLNESLRKILAYPLDVAANEEESIFIFLPRTDMDEVPDAIRIKLAGEDSPILLRAPAVAAKK